MAVWLVWLGWWWELPDGGEEVAGLWAEGVVGVDEVELFDGGVWVGVWVVGGWCGVGWDEAVGAGLGEGGAGAA